MYTLNVSTNSTLFEKESSHKTDLQTTTTTCCIESIVFTSFSTIEFIKRAVENGKCEVIYLKLFQHQPTSVVCCNIYVGPDPDLNC